MVFDMKMCYWLLSLISEEQNKIQKELKWFWVDIIYEFWFEAYLNCIVFIKDIFVFDETFFKSL